MLACRRGIKYHRPSTNDHQPPTNDHQESAMLNLKSRIDNVQYALACDDEFNAHYNLKPCYIYRSVLAFKAFFFISGEK